MRKFWLNLSFFIAFLMIFMVCFANFLTPFDPNEIDLTTKFEPASLTHFLGTDHLGRDIFSRLMVATATSLGSAFATIFLILFVGIVVGGAAGFVGGRTDQALMRLCDVFFSVPTIVLALFLVGVLGTGLINVIIAIAATHWAWYARIVRSIVLSLKNADYVLITATSGASAAANFKKNMLRPILAQCAVLASLDIGHIVLHISGLSFLGLGVKAPAAEWGVMISDAKEYIFSHAGLIFYPGAMIFLCVMSFNVIGDFLRDKFEAGCDEARG